jgi:hypothetical protein
VIVAGHAAGVLAGWIEGMIVGGVGAAVAEGLVGERGDRQNRSESR